MRSIKPKNVAELIEEWEDYEEPKVPVPVRIISPIDEDDSEVIMELNTHEQAMEVVEKLMAWAKMVILTIIFII